MKVLVGTLNKEKAIVGRGLLWVLWHFLYVCNDESNVTSPLQLNVCEGGQLYSWREWCLQRTWEGHSDSPDPCSNQQQAHLLALVSYCNIKIFTHSQFCGSLQTKLVETLVQKWKAVKGTYYKEEEAQNCTLQSAHVCGALVQRHLLAVSCQHQDHFIFVT